MPKSKHKPDRCACCNRLQDTATHQVNAPADPSGAPQPDPAWDPARLPGKIVRRNTVRAPDGRKMLYSVTMWDEHSFLPFEQGAFCSVACLSTYAHTALKRRK